MIKKGRNQFSIRELPAGTQTQECPAKVGKKSERQGDLSYGFASLITLKQSILGSVLLLKFRYFRK